MSRLATSKWVTTKRSGRFLDLIVGLFTALLFLIALALGPGVGCDPCVNSVMSEASSPSGDHRAVVFLRNCGATTSYSVELSILRGDERLPTWKGNAFSADAGYSDAPLKLEVHWDSDQALTVRHDPRLRLFQNEAKVGPIGLRYVAAESAP
ncbi:hypothetical protein [Anaeromyxobacter sp. Fw109-5]|uniref:hypothetical protein n=1 Tax=Anaeromyxobacter sp. (strain Fw109-5) TaxID=404589 RepID=UPI00059E7D4E|nr:hypothetical protein [Anaeromyxobacter sp. Fw109-5]